MIHDAFIPLDDAALAQLAHALEHGGRGLADLAGDFRIGDLAVLLKYIQDS